MRDDSRRMLWSKVGEDVERWKEDSIGGESAEAVPSAHMIRLSAQLRLTYDLQDG